MILNTFVLLVLTFLNKYCERVEAVQPPINMFDEDADSLDAYRYLAFNEPSIERDKRDTGTKPPNIHLIKSKTDSVCGGRRMVIPLLDLAVLWGEGEMLRAKRSYLQTTKRGAAGSFFSRLLQNKDLDRARQATSQLIDENEGIFNGMFDPRGKTDAFVDSLVGMMSKSDPSLLRRLRERISEFEERPRSTPLYFHRKGDSSVERPLIQFFNVTKISVSADDDMRESQPEDVKTNKKKLQQNVGHNTEEDEDDEKSDVQKKGEYSALLKTEDGQVARIQRSRDRRRYKIEIEYSTLKTDQEGNFPLKGRQRARNLDRGFKNENFREKKSEGSAEENVPVFAGWKDIIGKGFDNSDVEHSFRKKGEEEITCLGTGRIP